MPEDAARMRLALHRVWDEIARRAYHHYGRRTLTADEVRLEVLKRLEEESLANVNIRKFWTELSEQEKRWALADAFPNGPYPCRVEEDQDIRDDGVFD